MSETAHCATPHVGIFWVVQTTAGETHLLAAGCPLDEAEPGHYETWAHWRRDRTIDPAMRAMLRSDEYEDWGGEILVVVVHRLEEALQDRRYVKPPLRKDENELLGQHEPRDIAGDSSSE
jgi:hypothetical protein